MPLLIILGVVTVAGIAATGYALNQAGTAVQKSSSSLSDLALIGGGVFIAGKVMKAW